MSTVEDHLANVYAHFQALAECAQVQLESYLDDDEFENWMDTLDTAVFLMHSLDAVFEALGPNLETEAYTGPITLH
ncbi:MAG: hypothetical protein AB7S74_16095 [Hyphomicrobium sp.]